MVISIDSQTFLLKEAAEESRRANRWGRAIIWGMFIVFWTVAALLILLPTSSSLWIRAVVAAVLAGIPLVSFSLARALQPHRMRTKRTAQGMQISARGVDISFERGPAVSHRWDEASLRVIVFEAVNTGGNPRRWLYFNSDTVYEGIRLSPAAYDALSQALVRGNFSKTLDIRVAKLPSRRLTWTTYFHQSSER